MGFIVKAVKSVVKAVVSVVEGVFKGLGMVLGLVKPKGNASNSATSGRLSKRLEPEDFRKIIFGQTAGATDLRYWEVVNTTTLTRYDEVLAAAGHQIDGFGDLYIEDELVPFTGTAATGKYAGVLTRQTKLGTNPQTALAVGAGSLWTASSKFTGTAHYLLSWTIDEQKLPGGVPSRYTQVIRGALVYDPRRDSTRGGVGTHRADDQATWSYATVDGNGKPIGRNNALQMLWYLIGWRINGLLVAGRGVELEDINFAEFIAAANDCEAQGYYTDMILSTGDEHEQNESIISADGLIGELLDPGGLWTYKVLRDDTLDVAVDLGEDDVIEDGEVQWVPEARLSEKFNEVAGSFIDPSVTSLYQDKAYPTIKDASYATADGYKKRVSHNFQCVQDPALAQKLARIKLNRSRFSGEFTASFNFRALKATTWSIVRLTLPRYGFALKRFRVLAQTITESGIDMILREENATIYAGGTVVEPAAPSGSPSKYDVHRKVALTALASLAITYTAPDGSTQVGSRITWNQVPGTVRRIEVEYKPSAEATWASAGVVGADRVGLDVLGLLGGVAYDFRARTWTIHEVPGDWQVVGASTAVATVPWSQVGGTLNAPEDNATRNVNRGSWVNATAYLIGDIVSSGSPASSYYCLANHTSSDPTMPPHTNWAIYAAAGTDGIPGIAPETTGPIAYAVPCTANLVPKTNALVAAGGTMRLRDAASGLIPSGVSDFIIISSNNCAASINATTGAYTFSDISAIYADATFKCTYLGVDFLLRISLTKVADGASSSQVTDSSTVSAITSTSYPAANSEHVDIDVYVPAGTTLNIDAHFNYTCTAVGSFAGKMKVTYQNVTDGGAETDLASVVGGTAYASFTYTDEYGSGYFTHTPSVGNILTSLTNAAGVPKLYTLRAYVAKSSGTVGGNGSVALQGGY